MTSISMPGGSKEFCLPFNFCFGTHTARQDIPIPIHLPVIINCRKKTMLVLKASYSNERNSIDDFIANANRFIDIQELTPEIVHAFVSKIYVYEKKEKWSRTEGNDIDIVFTVGFREQHTVRTSDAIAS